MSRPDPVRLRVYENLFAGIAEEMGIALARSAFSTNIKERLDLSCAVFDREGEMLAHAAHIPVHLGSTPLSVRAAIEKLDLGPGDMALLNDPYAGGTHLPDLTLVAPVWRGEEKIFYVANRAHHADVGGPVPGSMGPSQDIFGEGIRIPPVLLWRGGERVSEVWDLLLANMRLPDERKGDLDAQTAANRTGERRLISLVETRGIEEIQTYGRHLLDHSERSVAEAIRGIPDGEYQFEDFLDNDGLGSRPIRIAVRIRVSGEKMTVDFSGTDPQTEGGMNANYAITLSALFYVIRCIVPFEIPSSSGCLRSVELITPEGSVVAATYPAGVAGGNVETSQRIVDVLLGALAQAVPERVPAAAQGTMNNLAMGGYDPHRERHWSYYETIGGGMGAGPGWDGESGIQVHMTNTRNTPIEHLENEYPVRCTSYRIRPESGGRGERRGGDGIIREIEFLAPTRVTLLSERRSRQPYGLSGGEPGATGVDILIRGDQLLPLPAKGNFRAEKGDILKIATPGGGGWGKS
ncbi:MAG: hydantoinase B/oxoprolinase family protein [Planctomycetota bacterium]|nr:hydantoinase B/oxoprolinase family protein [Planctomycetota bacterium]